MSDGEFYDSFALRSLDFVCLLTGETNIETLLEILHSHNPDFSEFAMESPHIPTRDHPIIRDGKKWFFDMKWLKDTYFPSFYLSSFIKNSKIFIGQGVPVLFLVNQDALMSLVVSPKYDDMPESELFEEVSE